MPLDATHNPEQDRLPQADTANQTARMLLAEAGQYGQTPNNKSTQESWLALGLRSSVEGTALATINGILGGRQEWLNQHEIGSLKSQPGTHRFLDYAHDRYGAVKMTTSDVAEFGRLSHRQMSISQHPALAAYDDAKLRGNIRGVGFGGAVIAANGLLDTIAFKGEPQGPIAYGFDAASMGFSFANRGWLVKGALMVGTHVAGRVADIYGSTFLNNKLGI